MFLFIAGRNRRKTWFYAECLDENCAPVVFLSFVHFVIFIVNEYLYPYGINFFFLIIADKILSICPLVYQNKIVKYSVSMIYLWC